MADGRKNNGGHSTKGKAGRKPLTDEIAKIKLMRKVMPDEKVWRALSEKIKEGDTSAIKFWIEQLHGKPKERVEQITEIKAPEFKWGKE